MDYAPQQYSDQPKRRVLSDTRQAADFVPTRITSLLTAEDLQRKDRQQTEMKQALIEQMQDKERRKKEARQREIEEDLRQEEKIRKQRMEMNDEFKKEGGKPQFHEEEYRQSEKLRDEVRNSPVRQRQVRTIGKKRPPTPVPLEVEIAPKDHPASMPSAPARLVYVKELWREHEEMNQKQAQLQQLISELKEQATTGSRQHNPSTDFEAIKKEMFKPPPQQYRPSHDPWTTLHDSSRFVAPRSKPFAQVGHRLVTLDRSAKSLPSALLKTAQDYSMVESVEVRNQLGKLDGLLDFCMGGAEKTQSGPKLQIQRQEHVHSTSPRRESPELRGDVQSVPLDFTLSPTCHSIYH